jgi:hypothetical protein
MLTEGQAASAYEQATDGCHNARLWQRVKPDPETNPLAYVECEKIPMWDEPLVTTPPPHLCSGRTDCIASAIQPPGLSVLPTGTGCVAAV